MQCNGMEWNGMEWNGMECNNVTISRLMTKRLWVQISVKIIFMRHLFGSKHVNDWTEIRPGTVTCAELRQMKVWNRRKGWLIKSSSLVVMN